MADLGPALGPAAVAPVEAGLDQARLPLLHLRRTRPPVALRSLGHRSPPPQLPCRGAEEQMTWLEADSELFSELCWKKRAAERRED